MPLTGLYKELRHRFGYRDWWPGDTRDEVVIGAILTQQASWKNVERAIHNLKKNEMLSLQKIAGIEISRLEELVRPSGFYKQKARRLKGFAQHVKRKHGSLDRLFGLKQEPLRQELLGIKGIGPETADSMLLYAAEKPVFVVDAYTKRIMSRVYGIDPDMEYHELQSLITSEIPKDIGLYNDFHAQFVELGKSYCKTKPLCSKCPVKPWCSYYKAHRTK